MKKVSFLRKHSVFAFVKNAVLMIAGGLALTGCENFLDGGDFSGRLKDDINYANADSCIVTVSSDTTSGWFLNSGEIECRKGYEYELQFNVNSEDYIFNGIKAVSKTDSSVSRNDCFADPPSIERLPGNTESYSIKVKLLKPAADILICPDCTLIPKVVSITPAYEPYGCDQDTPIVITFNKSMASIPLINFSNITVTDINGKSLMEYFEQPRFKDSEKKVLTIPVRRDKYLFAPDAEAEFKEILVTLDSSKITDMENTNLVKTEPHEYRINKKVDSVPPAVKEIHVYSTEDTEDFFYRELYQGESLNENAIYNPDGTVKYPNGNCTQNHVSKVYITLEGYDEQSGVDSLWVRETYKINSTLVSESENEVENTKFVYAPGKISVSMTGNYTLKIPNPEAEIILDFFIKDKAGNKSDCVQYHVLNNSYFTKTGITLSFEDFNQEKLFNAADENGMVLLPAVSNFTDVTCLYTGVYTYYSRKLLNIQLTDDNGNVTKLAENVLIEEKQCSKEKLSSYLQNVKYNPRKTNYLRISLKEESGMLFEKNITLYKGTHITDVEHVNSSKWILKLSDDGINTAQEENFRRYIYYTFKSSENAEETGPFVINTLTDSNTVALLGPEKKNLWLKKLPKGNGIYKFYVSTRVNGICLPFEDYYIYDTSRDNGYGSAEFPSFTLPGEDAFVYGNNNGKVKFTINAELPENDLTYNIFIGQSSFLFNEEIEVDSGYDYPIYLTATDSNGRLVSRYTPSVNGSPMVLSLRAKDNILPSMGTNGIKTNLSYYCDSSFFRCETLPFDYDKDRRQVNTVSKLECYFVSCDIKTSGLTYEQVKETSFYNYEVQLNEQILADGYFVMPVGDFLYGDYDVYYYFKDASGNSSLVKALNHICYFISDVKASFSMRKVQEQDYKIHLEAINYQKIEGIYMDKYRNAHHDLNKDYVTIFFLNDGRWSGMEQKWLKNASGDYLYLEYDYDSYYSGKFIKATGIFVKESENFVGVQNTFMQPIFVYPDYYKYLADHDGLNSPAYCMNKSWMKVQNGWQVFCDRPCFVHTLYCPKKLTAGNTEEDASVWEARGMETGLVSSNGTMFTYTDDNLSGVPSGSWYTTIAHFADGTVLMTEVQQK